MENLNEFLKINNTNLTSSDSESTVKNLETFSDKTTGDITPFIQSMNSHPQFFNQKNLNQTKHNYSINIEQNDSTKFNNKEFPTLENFKKVAKANKKKGLYKNLGESLNALAREYGFKEYRAIKPILEKEEINSREISIPSEILNFIKQESKYPYLNVFGVAGIGKTFLFNQIKKNFNRDIYFINLIDDYNVSEFNPVNAKMINEIRKKILESNYKIILIDEATLFRGVDDILLPLLAELRAKSRRIGLFSQKKMIQEFAQNNLVEYLELQEDIQIIQNNKNSIFGLHSGNNKICYCDICLNKRNSPLLDIFKILDKANRSSSWEEFLIRVDETKKDIKEISILRKERLKKVFDFNSIILQKLYELLGNIKDEKFVYSRILTFIADMKVAIICSYLHNFDGCIYLNSFSKDEILKLNIDGILVDSTILKNNKKAINEIRNKGIIVSEITIN